jgi:hypothetical protein
VPEVPQRALAHAANVVGADLFCSRVSLRLLRAPSSGAPNMSGPIYAHNCSLCRYLGHFRAHDLYYCKAQEAHYGMPTVIARWGNEGPDYVSSLALAPMDPILIQALVIVETGGAADWIAISDDYARAEGAMWARSVTELVEAMLHARKRAEIWKRTAKRIWTRCVPDTVGRFGSAARDVRMQRLLRSRGDE